MFHLRSRLEFKIYDRVHLKIILDQIFGLIIFYYLLAKHTKCIQYFKFKVKFFAYLIYKNIKN